MLLEQEANALNSDLDENNENQDDYDDENGYEYEDYGMADELYEMERYEHHEWKSVHQALIMYYS